MKSLSRHLRPLARLVAIALLVVGAFLASNWFEMLLHATDSSIRMSAAASGPTESAPSLTWAIPLLLMGLLLLVVTRRRERILSLTHHSDDS